MILMHIEIISSEVIDVNIGERIRMLRLAAKLTQEELANAAGTTKQTIHKYETGIISNIPASKIKFMADKLNTTPAYLMGWHESNDLPIEKIEQLGIKPIKTKKFRMLGEIACGEPIYINQDYETYVEASEDINADFCITARGDSMINARIFDGDVVFIREQPDVENGEIAAVVIEDTITLKRVYKYDGRLELRPENPTHRVQNYEKEELNQIRILGKAVAFQSYVR